MYKKYNYIFIAIIIIAILLFFSFGVLNKFFGGKISTPPDKTNIEMNNESISHITYTDFSDLKDISYDEFYSNNPIYDSGSTYLTIEAFNDFNAYYYGFTNEKYDDIYFDIMRGYIFDEPIYQQGDVGNFISCIEGKISASDLKDNLFSSICLGENKYDDIEKLNYFREKDKLIKFKSIIVGNNFDCKYFLENKYILPTDISNIEGKITDYLSCKLTTEKDSNKILADYFFFQKAYYSNNCNYLKDKNLSYLCEDYIKINSKNK